MDEATYLQSKKEFFIKQLNDDINHCNRVIESDERDIAYFEEFSQREIKKVEGYEKMTEKEKEQEKFMILYRMEKDKIQRRSEIDKCKKLIALTEKTLQELQ
ncbi:MAG: hypothetical protein WCH65_05305 [bacterium]